MTRDETIGQLYGLDRRLVLVIVVNKVTPCWSSLLTCTTYQRLTCEELFGLLFLFIVSNSAW